MQPHPLAGSARTVGAAQHLLALIEEHHAALYGYVLLLLHDREETEDVLQETFARAYRNLQRSRPATRAWLYRVARNLALDELRRRKRIGITPDHLESVAEASTTQDYSAVQRALESLSPDDRELLYLADVDALSSQEIADLYGIRAGTARTRLFRAHVRFRTAYEAQQ